MNNLSLSLSLSFSLSFSLPILIVGVELFSCLKMLNTEEGREGVRCACVGCEASKNKNEL